MKTTSARMLCRLLVALMIWMPMHMAQAGMIGTDQVASGERATLTSQLQTLGVDAALAKARVNAMTDEEVRSVAAQIDSLPAGADSTGIILLVLIAGAVVWWVWFRK